MSDQTGPKWYLVSDGRVSKLLCSEESPKLRYDGGPWSSRSCGYDTEEACREKEGVSDRPCMECGNMFGTNYSTPVKEQLRALGICFDCNYWRKYFLQKGNSNNAVVLGHHYQILANESGQGRGMQGHGGRTFYIRFRGGAVVTTTNLWHQGEISPTWRERLPDNAEFVKYPAVERLCCSCCQKEYDLKERCNAAVTRSLAGMGEESNCSMCGEPNGGAWIPTVYLEGDKQPSMLWGLGRYITAKNGRRYWIPTIENENRFTT